MRLFFGSILSLLVPVAAGWRIATVLWPGSSRGVRLVVAMIAGMGLAGSVFLAALSIADSSRIAFAASEFVLAAVIVFVRERKKPKYPERDVPGTERPASVHGNSPGERRMRAGFLLVLAVASAALLFLADYSRPGGWDAVALWNTKARFIYRGDQPLQRLSDVASEHPDYPLLLPSLVARGWIYIGRDSRAIPLGLALLFTICTMLIMVGGLKRVCDNSQALLTGCVLLGTPFFLQHGVSQYADIVLCCFITTTVVAFCVHDSSQWSWRLPLLAGLTAGAAACTKNEGLLFVLVIAGSRLLLAWLRKAGARGILEVLLFGAGASAGLAAIALFKTLHSPPNQITQNFAAQIIIERIGTGSIHSTILKHLYREAHDFGAWWLFPAPLLLLHFAVSRFVSPRHSGSRSWQMPALVVSGMLAGYYAVYVLSPYDLEWYLGSSLPRLLLQIWPTALMLYATAVSSRKEIEYPILPK